MQWRRHGELKPLFANRKTSDVCSYKDCGRPNWSKGYCHAHYRLARAGRELRPIRATPQPRTSDLCSHPGCGEPYQTWDLCRSHYHRLRNHNITLAAFDALLETQGHRCACCGAPDPGGVYGWCVDHDHACCPGDRSCGRCIRGLICGPCNKGLGHFKDSIETMQAGIRYLQRWEAR